MFRKLLTFACLSLGLSQLTPFGSLNGVGVQLFQWKFTDIASECTFLANNGYSYVQTSPVQEHIYNIGHPIYDTYWYNSYAPIGYNIGNRLGSLTEFQLMVSTCNSLGVAVVVDVVLNHLSTTGTHDSGGFGSSQSWSAVSGSINFPDPVYGNAQTHNSICSSSTDYSSLWNIWNCQLLGLVDIATETTTCQTSIKNFLNTLIGYGVSGFRVDAAKSIVPDDLGKIFTSLNNIPSGPYKGQRPFYAQEIYDFAYNGTNAYEGTYAPYYTYPSLGRIIDFTFSQNVGQAFRNLNGQTTDLLGGIVYNNQNSRLTTTKIVNIVENHDLARNQYGNQYFALSRLNNAWNYKQAVAFNILYPYGVSTIHSDYVFSYATGNNDETPLMNPVSQSTGMVLPVGTITNNICPSAYMCQHRWSDVFSLVQVRNYMYSGLTNPSPYIVSNGAGSNQIWFNVTGKGLVVINSAQGTQAQQSLIINLNAGLPAGKYCNMVYGYMSNGVCVLWSGVSLTNGETLTYTIINANEGVNINSGKSDKSRVVALYTASNGFLATPVVTVTFTITYNTGYPNNMYISGTFNGWATCSANVVSCNWNTGNVWTCVTQLQQGVSYDWKPIFYSGNYLTNNCGTVHWACGGNNQITGATTPTQSVSLSPSFC